MLKLPWFISFSGDNVPPIVLQYSPALVEADVQLDTPVAGTMGRLHSVSVIL